MKKNILLVEDHRTSRIILTYLLRNEGHDVVEVGTAEDAYVSDLHQFNVAVLDLGLPGEQGDVFAHHLLEQNPKVRLIFVSGDPNLEKLTSEFPASHIIRKPVGLEKLVHLIEM